MATSDWIANAKGTTVEVVRGTIKAPAGTTGMVFWAGETKTGPRIGFNDEYGRSHFVAASAVRVTGVPSAQPPVSPVLRYRSVSRLRETEKSFLLDGEWFPKSQCPMLDGWVGVPEWLIRKKYGTISVDVWVTLAEMRAAAESSGGRVKLRIGDKYDYEADNAFRKDGDPRWYADLGDIFAD